MSTTSDIWDNHQELYPIPEGFEDSTYHNDATPSYTGLHDSTSGDDHCVIWIYDNETSKDCYGDTEYRPAFTVHYNPSGEAYGTTENEGTRTIDLHSWNDVLWLIEILNNDQWLTRREFYAAKTLGISKRKGNMKTELRKVKIAESLSRDSTAFTADLIVNGEHIAYLSDDGNGGDIFIDHVEGCRDKVQAFEEWCETLSPRESYEDLPMSAELFIGDLLEEWEENKFLKRLCRTKTVIRLEGDRAGEYTTFKKAYDAEFAKSLRATTTGLVEIYNERFLS